MGWCYKDVQKRVTPKLGRAAKALPGSELHPEVRTNSSSAGVRRGGETTEDSIVGPQQRTQGRAE